MIFLAHPPRFELRFYAPEAYVLSIELWVHLVVCLFLQTQPLFYHAQCINRAFLHYSVIGRSAIDA